MQRQSVEAIAGADGAVHQGRQPVALQAITLDDVELAVWQRSLDAPWWTWLQAWPADRLPACRTTLEAGEAAAALRAACDAAGARAAPWCDSFIEDASTLTRLFASVAGCDTVHLRLDVTDGDGCRRWHRDCVPTRLVCTYRGPGTQWVPPAIGDVVLVHADDDVPQALALPLGHVAVFKGCGWPGRGDDRGIVHRSPRIAGSGQVRLVLVLDPRSPSSCPPAVVYPAGRACVTARSPLGYFGAST